MLKKLSLYGLVIALMAMPLLFTACSERKGGDVMGPDATRTQVVNPGVNDGDGQDRNDSHNGGTIADQNWWRNLSQAERNMMILYRAGSYNGSNSYCNCKTWARQVVLEASHNVVNMPQTLPGESGWYFAYSPYFVGMSGGIRGSAQGTIVQLNWRLNDGSITPHTMIVSGRSSTGVYVIEANWSPKCHVGYRWISFTDFDSHVVRYSCYTVIGG